MSTSASSDIEGKSPGRVYGGVSAERRRSDRRQRLLDAGLELFGARGVAATTVGDVADRAGVIKRYFYESFENLDDLFDAVITETTAQVSKLVSRAAASSGDTKQRARAALAAFVDFMADNPHAGRMLMREMLTPRGGAAARRQQLLDRSVQVIWHLFLEGDGEDRPSRVEAHLTSLALAGASSEVIAAWLERRIVADRDQVLDHLSQLYYLAAGIRTSR
jgi:AcrR family transcriptional regulator